MQYNNNEAPVARTTRASECYLPREINNVAIVTNDHPIY
ncbi:hypothetical protein Xmir_04059 [Xenorhabdus miraniensis]|uniref:Uncharacterized protein n=1 Tax=Xenorhabdus miraniensis TaxID=351674 RepID=A0A2D0JK43_9GAMM|nr:hypothetical protein Xmir_04059 [Xenorhabdus miraniensis]